jgi:hypothetical protein
MPPPGAAGKGVGDIGEVILVSSPFYRDRSKSISLSTKTTQPSKQRVQKHSDFSEEYANSEVVIVLHDGQIISGRIAESRRYWFKVVTQDNKVLYVNKAWVVYVAPKK